MASGSSCSSREGQAGRRIGRWMGWQGLGQAGRHACSWLRGAGNQA